MVSTFSDWSGVSTWTAPRVLVQVLPDCFQRAAGRVSALEAMHQPVCVFAARRARQAEPEDDFALLAVGQIEPHLDRRTGVQAGPDLPGQMGA